MRTPKIFSPNTNIFNLFTDMVSEYENKTILDFGGNHGNLIKSSDGKILPEFYTCLDINQEPLDQLPANTKSIYWNRYHPTYNPDGKMLDLPYIGKYDIVFANSVFTHMSLDEILFCIQKLYKVTNNIYFTYVDNKNVKFFDELKAYTHPIKLTDEQIFGLRENKINYVVNHEMVYHSYPEVWPSDWHNMWTVVDTDYFTKTIRYILDNVNITTGKTIGFNWMHINMPTSWGINPAIGY